MTGLDLDQDDADRGPRLAARTRRAAALAGLLCGLLAAPASVADGEAGAAPVPVTAVVRTELGQLKWAVTEAKDYTPLEAEGRRLYLESGCMFCHSQHLHPIRSENRPWGRVSNDRRRWGPATEPGEFAFDDPPSFGARGIAPDLSRTGLKFGDEWHWAHFWNPPMVVPGSIMGGFSGLFDRPPAPLAVVDGPHGRTLERTADTEALFDFSSERLAYLTPGPDGVVFAPMSARGAHPVIWTPNEEFDGDAVTLIAESPRIAALTAYVQTLGMNRGKWREVYAPDERWDVANGVERSDAMIARGEEVYVRNCLGCHGVEGDGNGPAATFMTKQRPRNFTFGVFKFKLADGPLPTDADLLRTITRGVRGTAMPAWFELPLEDRLSVIQYVKYELAVDRSDPTAPWFYFVEEQPGAVLEIGPPPAPSADLVARGGEIWRQAKCWECHGEGGRGDGEKAAGLRDATGFPIIPANLALGLFKSGPGVDDVFRTISVGLAGTPMPAFKNAFPEQDRWALAYFVLSLSAYTDPRTGGPLAVPEAVRAALSDPELETPTPAHAQALHQIMTGPGQ
jgi:cytochrome c oxidase cbb3-type subunit 2